MSMQRTIRRKKKNIFNVTGYNKSVRLTKLNKNKPFKKTISILSDFREYNKKSHNVESEFLSEIFKEE